MTAHWLDTSGQQRRRFLGIAAAVATGSLPGIARAQSYPTRAVTFICPWPAGGTADMTMRVLAQIIGRELGQPVVVENRAGAAGMIGAKALAAAKPDGYTIGQLALSVTRFSQLGTVQIDPLKDYTFLGMASAQTFGIVVAASSPFKTLQDLVNEAPNGVAAPAGLDPTIAARLEKVVGLAVNRPEFKSACEKIDAPVIYMDGAQYRQYVTETYRKETVLIEKLQLKKLLEG